MSTQFQLLLSESLKDDLEEFRTYDRRVILEAIETQLTDSPTVETRTRKLLQNLVPPFEAVPRSGSHGLGLFASSMMWMKRDAWCTSVRFARNRRI